MQKMSLPSLLRFWVLLTLSFGLTACKPQEFTFYVFSMSEKPVSILVNGEDKDSLALGKGTQLKVPRKAGTEIRIQQGDKTLDVYRLGDDAEQKPGDKTAPTPLKLSEDEQILYIAGGPESLVLANYTDFYGEAPEKPQIRDVVSLRHGKLFHISGDDMISFPSPVFPREMTEGKQMLRLVPVPPQVPDNKILPYLYLELKQLK